ncbi:MAG: hypothetical protein GXC78_10405 [Chitinophagaceae bacterium]|nr:hypothetical protein [Chitinophagaceae bacterium]
MAKQGENLLPDTTLAFDFVGESVWYDNVPCMFCLKLSNQNLENENDWHEVLATTFLPNYADYFFAPIFIVDPPLLETTLFERFKQFIYRQGYHSILPVPFAGNLLIEVADNLRPVDEMPEIQNMKLQFWIDQADNIEDLVRIIEFQLQEEKDDNLTHLSHTGSWQHRGSYLNERRLLAAVRELEKKEQQIKILQQSSQAKKIQAHYDVVYERMPIWYKKLGALIRMLNSKKYE